MEYAIYYIGGVFIAIGVFCGALTFTAKGSTPEEAEKKLRADAQPIVGNTPWVKKDNTPTH